MTLRPLSPLVLVLAACSACGDDGTMTADAAPPDPCAPQMTFTGELVDWDSGSSGFLGIFSANFTLRSNPTFTDMTAPNGRFEMCIPSMDGLVDVTPVSGSGYVSGVVVVSRAVLASQPLQSYRSFKDLRAQDFGFSPSLAQVYVHVHGAARTVTASAVPGSMHRFDGTAWAAGNTGNDIYLANVPVMSQTNLVVTGGAVTGPTTIPLSAGAFTYVTLVAN